tara:strand:- start:95 stop:874 length:780 start_codon:yes stop_codon:yes gene_type:complete
MSLSSYNGHSNFTIKGKKFIKRGADNIYDIASVAGTGGNFSTGWVNTDGTTTVNNGADLNFNHNLGTTDLTFAVYVADDASGTNATLISTVDTRVNPYVWTGAQVQNLTTTSFRLRLGGGQHSNNQSGYTYLYSPTGGQNTGESYTGKYIKVIASAGGTTLRAYGAFTQVGGNFMVNSQTLADGAFNMTGSASKTTSGVGYGQTTNSSYIFNFGSEIINPRPIISSSASNVTNWSLDTSINRINVGMAGTFSPVYCFIF